MDGMIYKQIPAVMADIEAIAKDRKNDKQNYKFRGIDDVYNMIHSVLAKHKVFTAPTVLSETYEERKSSSGGVLIYRVLRMLYRFYAEDGSYIDTTVIGEGMDSGDKASNKAMSVAHKYALIQVFAIPTDDDKDPENDNPQPQEREKGNNNTRYEAPISKQPKPEPKITDLEAAREATKAHLDSVMAKLPIGTPTIIIQAIAQAKTLEDLKAIYKDITEAAKPGKGEIF